MTVLYNMPSDRNTARKLLQAHVNIEDSFVTTSIFTGFEQTHVLKEVASMMKFVTSVKTFKINNNLTELQRKIIELLTLLEIPNEIISINTWEEQWLEQ